MTVFPGALVSYREREWGVLPSDNPNLILRRPIGGSAREVCGVVKPLADLMAYEAPHERIETAQFPLPSPEDVQDHAAVRPTARLRSVHGTGMTVPDFFYEPNICVYCDGSVHDEPQQRASDEAIRRELNACGDRVVMMRYAEDIEKQVQQQPDVFGEAPA